MPLYSKPISDDPEKMLASAYGRSIADKNYLPLMVNKLGMVVSEHPYVAYSQLGNYFIGTTPIINIPINNACIVAIKNPANSGKTIQLAAITIYANLSRLIGFYFDATHNLTEIDSTYITLVNRTKTNQSVARVVYATGSTLSLSGSLSFFRVTNKSYTEKIEFDGKIILGPGNNFLLDIGPDNTAGNLIIAWGWIEI